MKRKEIKGTIAKVGASTFALNGSMTLLNKKTGEAFDIDMASTLAIIRGTLVWVDSLFDEDAEHEPSAVENMQKLLACVGSSIACEMSGDEEE